MIVSMDKNYMTRRGDRVTLLGIGRGAYPVKGYIANNTSLTCWKIDGTKTSTYSYNDLVEVAKDAELTYKPTISLNKEYRTRGNKVVSLIGYSPMGIMGYIIDTSGKEPIKQFRWNLDGTPAGTYESCASYELVEVVKEAEPSKSSSTPKFWMVFNGRDTARKCHYSLEEAKKEAERLTTIEKHPFYVLEAILQTQAITTTETLTIKD